MRVTIAATRQFAGFSPMRLSRSQYNTVLIASVAALIANIFAFRSSFIGLPAAVIFVSMLSIAAACYLTKNDNSIKPADLFRGLLLFSSLWTIVASLLYYLWRLDNLALTLTAGLFAIFATVKNRRGFIVDFKLPVRDRCASTIALALIAAVALVLSATLLLQRTTEAAIRSPWEVVDARFFVLLTAAIFTSLILALKKDGRLLAGAFLFCALLLGLTVAASVYKIGFGYDQFIHEAAMREISREGVVLPKTPYYVGAYVDIVSIIKFGALDLHLTNKFFGPLVATALLTAAGVLTAGVWGIVFIFFLPLSHFIMTTPQGVADALALIALVIAFRAAQNKDNWPLAFAPALAALVSHPIAGMPAFLLVATLFFAVRARRVSGKILAITAGSAALIAFPVTAMLIQQTAPASLQFAGAFSRVIIFIRTIFPFPETKTFLPINSLLYFGRLIFPAIYIAACVSALASKENRRIKVPLFVLALTVPGGGLLLHAFVNFNIIPANEELIFPQRFLALGAMFLFPLFAETLLRFLKKFQKSFESKIFFSIFISVFCVSAIYFAYPRIDSEDKSKGYSVSAATIEAVDTIHNRASGDYIVLANQTATAAEVWRRGFSRYHQKEFFYSSPSGAPRLNASFIRAMQGQENKEFFENLKREFKVDHVYLMIHDYWKNSNKIIEMVRALTDQEINIQNEKIKIFEY